MLELRSKPRGNKGSQAGNPVPAGPACRSRTRRRAPCEWRCSGTGVPWHTRTHTYPLSLRYHPGLSSFQYSTIDLEEERAPAAPPLASVQQCARWSDRLPARTAKASRDEGERSDRGRDGQDQPFQWYLRRLNEMRHACCCLAAWQVALSFSFARRFHAVTASTPVPRTREPLNAALCPHRRQPLQCVMTT